MTLLPALLTTALAAPPPNLDDIGAFVDGAAAALELPGSCWDVEAEAAWHWDLGRYGTASGRTPFFGRVEDGEWVAYGNDVRVQSDPRFRPVVGRHADLDGEEDSALHVVDAILSSLKASTETAWTRWDEAADAVVLDQDVSLGRRARAPVAQVSATFPDGAPRASRVTVRLPEGLTRGFLRRYRIDEGEVVVYTRPHPSGVRVPAHEQVSATITTRGQTFTGEQVIRYHALHPCVWKQR